MKTKLNCILLVDDDDATNYIHKRAIMALDCTQEIITKSNGQEALDFLKSTVNGKYPQPELIFLDINMPLMDGWEFLENYGQLDASQKSEIVIVMLTTSLNPDDHNKAMQISSISDFKPKPLTTKMLQDILSEHFNLKLSPSV